MQPEGGSSPIAISPEEYNLAIQAIVPLDVRLVDIDFHVKDVDCRGPLVSKTVLEEASTADATRLSDSSAATIEQNILLLVQDADGELVAEGRCKYRVRVRLNMPAPEGFWELFVARNTKLYTHPAARDLLASLVARASIYASPAASVSVVQPVNMSELPMRRIPEPG